MLRIKFFIVSFITFFLLLMGCSPKPRSSNEIYIGTITGPETQLVEVAKKVAEQRYGLKLKIIQFEDYVIPNTALAEGEIDANMFQHQPYLDVVIAKKHYALTPIAKMFIYPMAVYSHKYKSLAELPQHAVVGIPNDPSNAARALRLLAKAGLIEIPTKTDDLSLSPKSITFNPKQIVIKEIAAAQLPRVLSDLDAAVINTNYAIPAGLLPHRDGIFVEGTDSPYANLIVIRTDEKDKEKYQKLIAAMHSPEVALAAKKLFSNQAIQAW